MWRCGPGADPDARGETVRESRSFKFAGNPSRWRPPGSQDTPRQVSECVRGSEGGSEQEERVKLREHEESERVSERGGDGQE